MTGFARITGEVAAEVDAPRSTWTLSIKSVNHRFLDLHLRLPSGTEALEMQVRRLLKERVARGHLEVTLSWEPAAAMQDGPMYDKVLVGQYLAAFRDVQQEYELKQEPDLNAILRLPGVFRAAGSNNGVSSRREERGEALEGLEVAVLERLPEALAALEEMRETEGAALVGVLEESLARMEEAIAEAAALRARVQPAHYERLKQRMEELVQGAVGQDRLLQEAAILADRSDVEEELARLRVHVEHFRSLLRDGGDVGKKLDFLLQEMNREANTLLSKSAGMAEDGSRLTVVGLAIKSEIEKARERFRTWSS
jgi:uncharacterized protein (TIGR00255 family)